MSKIMERRLVVGEPIQLKREEGESKSTKLVGYAAVFNSLSRDLGGFKERIAPGAFRRALKDNDIRALHDHASGRLLGRSKSGTLKLREDDKGLAVEIDIPDTATGNEVMTLVERGDLSGMSFGFYLYEQGSSWVREGEQVIHDIMPDGIDLLEVSVVAWPAYDDTVVAVRDMFNQFNKVEKGKEIPSSSNRLLRARHRLLSLKTRG